MSVRLAKEQIARLDGLVERLGLIAPEARVSRHQLLHEAISEGIEVIEQRTEARLKALSEAGLISGVDSE